MPKRGWAIFDRGRQYINVLYGTEREAAKEMEDLLKPYPRGHEWRRRLHVTFVEDVLVRTGEPAFGYRWRDSRFGRHLVEHAEEQRVIRTVRRLRGLGNTINDIVKTLNQRGYRPRHGPKFTALQVDDLLQEIERRHDGRKEARPVEPSVGAEGP